MNRSRRRATAISWAFIAGLLVAVLGMPGTAVGAADPGRDGGSGQGQDGANRSGLAAGPAGPDPGPGTLLASVAPAPRGGRVAPGVVVAAKVGDSVSGTPAPGGRAAIPLQLRQPVDRFPPGLPRIALKPSATPPSTSAPPVVSDVAAVNAPAPVASASRPAAALSRAGTPAPSAPSPSRFSSPAAATPVLGPVEQLGPATLGDLTSLALPGIIGLLAVTALGGFLGYRQAKAGFVLQSSGTVRFLQ